jgi:enhancing lycopene biosynthesis protein 2
MKKIAVILCGCGSMDGSEIHEACMTLLAIEKAGGTYTVFAPNAPQMHVVNHYTKEVSDENRNMLAEAGRIARGDIFPLSEYRCENFDAIVFPGGFGVAKNLFTYAFDGINAKVRPDVEKLIKETYQARKPIGALCIAPVLLAKVLKNITITVGSDEQTIADVEQMGATHLSTQETEVVSDKQNLIFSTPCYMLPASIADIAKSAENLITAMMDFIIN